MPTVHIVITAYKSDELLTTAVGAALYQSHSDVLVTVIDDCSPIKCKEFLKGFLKDKRLRYVRLANNSGPSNARNVGLMLSGRAEYVTFHDDDDVPLPNKISYQLKQLSEVRQIDRVRMQTIGTGISLGYDIAVNKVIRHDKDGKIAISGEMIYLVRDVLPNSYNFFGSTGKKYSLHFPSALFRKSVFLRLGGFYPSLYGYEDNELAVRTMLGGEGYNFNETPVYFFNRTNDSLIYNPDDEQHQRLLDVFGHIQNMKEDSCIAREKFAKKYRQLINVDPGIEEAYGFTIKDFEDEMPATKEVTESIKQAIVK